jgi:hypothetical protein
VEQKIITRTKNMSLTYSGSAQDDLFEGYFYSKTAIFSKFAVARFDEVDFSNFNENEIYSEICRIASLKTRTQPKFWLLEVSSFWQPDTSVNRHLKGLKYSVVAMRNQKQGMCETHIGFLERENRIKAYRLYAIDLNAYQNWIEELVGLSSSLVIVDVNQKDDITSLGIELAKIVGTDSKGLTTVQDFMPQILDVLSNKQGYSVITGFGSEDFGGFFLDYFYLNQSMGDHQKTAVNPNE